METKIDFFLKQLEEKQKENDDKREVVEYDDSLTKYWINYETIKLYIREFVRNGKNEMHVL